MTAKNASMEVRAREFMEAHAIIDAFPQEPLTALLTAVASEAVAGERAVVGRDEFDARMKALEELPLVKSLLGAKLTFEKWSPTLQRDAYLKMGLEPVVMYRVVAEVDPHRKKPTVGGAS